MFLSIVLEIIDLYIDLYLILLKSIPDLDLELDLNQIVVLKEKFFDNEKVPIILCVKIAIFITIMYTFYDIRLPLCCFIEVYFGIRKITLKVYHIVVFGTPNFSRSS